MRRALFLFVAVLGVFISSPALLAQNDAASQPQKFDNVNAAVVAARAATKDKRYAGAESLMIKATESHPELIVRRIELGLAQLGLKKYPEAETSFKVALGIDTASQERAHSADFYQQPDRASAVAPSATRASRNTVGGVVSSGMNRTPELIGTGYASLGDIYIHQGKHPEAQNAFESAVKANPSQAALYLRNETIFFFEAGNADAQLAAAEKAIAVDPTRAMLYYFKGQALTLKATVDPQTQRPVLPVDCVAAYRKYLELEPNAQFASDANSVLAAAGISAKPGRK